MRVAESVHDNVTVTLDLLREATAEPALNVAFIHGLGAAPAIWESCVAQLPEQVRAWSFGLPWDAKNGPDWALRPDSRFWLARALELSPVQPDVYIAHSFGADVLLDLISKRGGMPMKGLVLLSPFYRATPAEFDWAALSHYLNDFDDLVRTGIVLRRGVAPSGDMLAGMIERVRERISPYGWMRFFDLFLQMPMLDLSKVTAPCLVIAGGRDTAAYPADCVSLARTLGAAYEIQPDSGHFTMVDDPAGVAQHITAFLKGLS